MTTVFYTKKTVYWSTPSLCICLVEYTNTEYNIQLKTITTTSQCIRRKTMLVNRALIRVLLNQNLIARTKRDNYKFESDVTVRARSLFMVLCVRSCSFISVSHFLQFCTYLWLPRLCLLWNKKKKLGSGQWQNAIIKSIASK